MIGNLLLLSLTALLGCSCAFGVEESTRVKAPLNQVTFQPLTYTSQKNGMTYDLYYNYQASLPRLNSTVTDMFTYINLNDQTVTGETNLQADGLFINDYVNTYETYQDRFSYVDYEIYMAFSSLPNNRNQALLRFFVPDNCPVDFIEFNFGYEFRVSLCNYDLDASLNRGGNRYWYNLTELHQTSFGDIQLGTYLPKFAEYVFLFDYQTGVGQYINSIPFNIYFCGGAERNIGYLNGYNAGYEQGKNDGYQNGLSVGNQQGYQTGYADGLAFATQNSTFNSLFGAIADTPVIFLRSLFNFDLFGMNMFIIIMSLITGLIVIYIVKKCIKFW